MALEEVMWHNHDMIPNPNGANGSTSDPREQTCWDIYIKGGMNNGAQAAREAGYSEASALHITTRDWFIERLSSLRRKEMLSKAERNLSKALDTNYENDEGKVMSDVMRIVVDVSKHMTETLGKNEGYSKRNELTGKDGADLPTPILNVFPDISDHKDTEAD